MLSQIVGFLIAVYIQRPHSVFECYCWYQIACEFVESDFIWPVTSFWVPVFSCTKISYICLWVLNAENLSQWTTRMKYLPLVLQKNISAVIDDNFCGWPTNVGIGSRYPLQTDTNVTLEHHLATALAVVIYDSKTVAVMGTSQGLVLKVSEIYANCETKEPWWNTVGYILHGKKSTACGLCSNCAVDQVADISVVEEQRQFGNRLL